MLTKRQIGAHLVRLGCALLLAAVSHAALANDELWPRLKAQSGLQHIQHPRIERWEQHWRRRSTELRVILEHRGHWLYPVLDELERRQLPAELAVIPIIESKLRTEARSSRDAYGLWQLRPKTAAYLGLRMDEWVDERAHPLLATRAGLNYLEHLHERFGSWPLTLAAYNAGQGRVSRAIRNARSHGGDPGYWALDLPQESQDYVPKILALARVLADSRGMRLPFIDPNQRPRAITTDGPVNVDTLAVAAGIDIDTVYAYNPHLRRWALPPRAPWIALVPESTAKRTQRALADMAETARANWQQVTIEPGDSLGRLAQRWNSSVAMIRQSNGLSSDTIRVGQALWVPLNQEKLSPALLAATQSGGRIEQTERAQSRQWYRVRSGDTLWDIAGGKKSKVAALRRWNAMTQDEPLIPGQLLRVAPPPGRRDTVHRLRAGDSLPKIADRYQVSVNELRRWNRLGSPNLPSGGELLVFAPF